MPALETVAGLLHELDTLLDDPLLLPDTGRRDWRDAKPKVDRVRELAEGIGRELKVARLELDADESARLDQSGAQVLAAAAAALFVSGERLGAAELLERAEALAVTPLREQLAAARQSPEWWVKLALGIRLRRVAAGARADRVLHQVRKACPSPELRAVAQAILAEPRPLRHAPTLSTVNGIGTMLYGQRDVAPDRSYTATQYFTFLFVPLVPLANYRVVSQDDGLVFLGQLPLGAAQRWYRRILAVTCIAVAAQVGSSIYLNSPARLASVELEQAQQLETGGDVGQALATYERVFEAYPDATSAPKALDAWLALQLRDLPDPLPLDRVADAERIARRLERLGTRPWARVARSRYAERLMGWAAALGGESVEKVRGGLTLLERAGELGTPQVRDAVKVTELSLRRTLADRHAMDWPMLAVGQYLQIADEAALRAAGEVLLGLGDAPSLYAESGFELNAFQLAAESLPSLSKTAAALKARQEDAPRRLLAEGREKLLDEGSGAQLQAALARWPADQGLGAAVAYALHGGGDTAGALAVLERWGAAGRLSGEAQLAMATTLRDLGRGAEAETILEHYLWRWLPRFESARSGYAQRAEQLESQLVKQANSGSLPMGITRELQRAGDDEAKQQAIFSEYVTKQLQEDTTLASLRQQYQQHAGVVGASLMLGSLRLERAGALDGKQREVMLARAEQAYLAVEEAEDSVEFQLGMGQVLHRLGRGDEGEAQLKAAVDRGDPTTAMRVASIYRELGLIQRAREVAESIFARGEQPWRDEAASVMSLMATSLEDKEAWLSKIVQESAGLKARRAELKAALLSRKGKVEEAEKELQVALVYYEAQASTDGASANNAAVVYQSRYEHTGDPGFLDRAAVFFERSLKLKAENAIILYNLAGVQTHRARIAVLDGLVDTRALRLSNQESGTVLRYLLAAAQGATIREQLRASPHLRRVLETCKRMQVVAPSDTDAYELELGWYSELQDEMALRALGARIDRVAAFDFTNEEEGRARWEAGRDDAQLRQYQQARLERLEGVLASKDARTRAVALVLMAEAARSLGSIEPSEKWAQATVGYLEKAQAEWPELGAVTSLPDALLAVALVKSAAADPGWAKVVQADWRRHTQSVIVHRAIVANPAAAQLLRQQPELGRAAAISASLLDSQLGPGDWVIASLHGDPSLQARVAAELRRPHLTLAAALALRLTRGPGYIAYDELVRTITGAGATAHAAP